MNVNQKKVAIETLGCRLNISESGTFADQFRERGYAIGKLRENVDVVLINTCCVTQKAEATCRNLIRKAKNQAPKAKIVVVGCYAQTAYDDIKKNLDVDLVLGSFEKSYLFKYLDEIEATHAIHVEKNKNFFSSRSTKAEGHTRAFLKIQDGCNYVCSYCIIPRARGESRSLPVHEVLKEATLVIDEGFKEIIITGVNIGDYKDGDKNLLDLTNALLLLKKLERLRLSSIEPNMLTKDFLQTLASNHKVMDHFHVPLQSGDDEILQKMRRKYEVKDYEQVIKNIKAYFPNAGVGADVIVGFPGETNQHYQNTKKLIEALPITHLHVFPFSKRKKTLAFSMPDEVNDKVKKDRVLELIEIGEKKLIQFAKDQEGKTFKVLFEKRNKNGFFEGFTSNFLNVLLETKEDLNNQIIKVKIKKAVRDDLLGEIVQ
ncbi:MAG: tRNA (N(6)-L-threonylcarbamoyladenosine(37)-C(2))-methylthiotransferase MtaB [Bdellovibrionales bacterium RIFOXYB1_FULL_37_110]|nr:MAG: tRNA (N(6)-L-threonylcarbamoyladenosine(37)-C(2))-methylthiotransferase MtaB [Bdellovibrionales bacterium RIFOXYC1_FULL_37_79]OFZ57162.1 MAG: tRNA (N(6)-L-threonylcarbamoyladenosine(37)-C(2))-methylthiotransferase MtaB [Bdellovibrionales bacterium RIFOXYB1_FULL_37_110]OFZ64900.1 MAG: tRNA (N(6)-L-threonylcarbamoyladenosine(37)-C(2))-methylthiotransferase MtaB [Bdellovibrionales bacterium RIFOXYD1_FULL_36_51]